MKEYIPIISTILNVVGTLIFGIFLFLWKRHVKYLDRLSNNMHNLNTNVKLIHTRMDSTDAKVEAVSRTVQNQNAAIRDVSERSAKTAGKVDIICEVVGCHTAFTNQRKDDLI